LYLLFYSQQSTLIKTEKKKVGMHGHMFFKNVCRYIQTCTYLRMYNEHTYIHKYLLLGENYLNSLQHRCTSDQHKKISKNWSSLKK